MTAAAKRAPTWPVKQDYMPLKLKTLLPRYSLSQKRLAAEMLQPNGRPYSEATVNLIINWGTWPRSAAREDIQGQIAAALRARGVPEEEIAAAWDDAPDTPRGATAMRHVRRAPAAGAAPSIGKSAVIKPVEPEMLSQNARKHFQLFRDPFADDVGGPDDVFLSADIHYIREAMYSTVRHGGFLAVVGESGAGKTILRRDLVDRIAREQQPITVIQPRVFDKAYLTASYICEAIIQDLRPGEGMRHSLEGKARQVERLLVDSSLAGRKHALIIEEAHDLSILTLKYLKRFFELEHGFRKLLAIILIGQPELKMKLDERVHFEAREVIRRIEIAELMPLDAELENYIAHKFARKGIERDVRELFEAGAYDAMRTRLTLVKRPATTHSRGEVVSQLYPLTINNLVIRALNLAAEAGAPRVNADVVREV